MLASKNHVLRLSLLVLFPAVLLACDDDSDSRLKSLDASVSGQTDAAPPDAAVAIDTNAPDAVIDSAPPNDAVQDALQTDALSADSAPPLAANALTAKQVAAGERWSLAVRPNGDLWAWGQYVDAENGHYQSGGNYAKRPVKVDGLSNVLAANGYGSAFFALKDDGTVWGWGFLNSYEAFGQGKDAAAGGQVSVFNPVQILQGAGSPLTRICDIVPTAWGVVMLRSETQAGTCIANEKRSVWFTGSSLTGYDSGLAPGFYAKKYEPLNPGGQQSVLGDSWVVSLFGNNYYVNSISLYAKLNDGRVFVWGSNFSGQLGLNDQTARSLPTEAPAWNGVQTIVSSSEVTLGVLPNGTVLAAGSPSGQTLGLGGSSTTNQKTPILIPQLAGVTSIGVATSSSSAFAVVDGGLRFWGSSTSFGEASATPRVYPNGSATLVAVSVGNYHALGIDARGGVYAWGTNQIYNLGCEACDQYKVPTLLTVP
jgi:alpha-tubulin suppressor-like RCC1 family protein